MRRTTLVLLLTVFCAAPAAGNDVIDAATAGDLEGIRGLIADDPGAVSVTDDRQCTALHFAVNEGHAGVVSFLLDAGADIEARDVDGDTPLHWAACTAHVAMIDLLVDRGADVDALNNTDQSPVLYATMRRQYANVERLADRGADLELANDYGRTPLLWTTREGGDIRMVELLLGRGANVDAVDRYGDTSLELAAWRGFRALVGILLDAGARVDVVPGMDQDLLLEATEQGIDRLYEKLVAAGTTIDVAPDGHTSLLHLAAAGGSARIVGDLLDRGAATDAVDDYGWTPLHHAADRGRAAAARALVAVDPAADRGTLSGHTPLSLAHRKGAPDVVAVLEKAGHTRSERAFPRLTGAYLGQDDPPAEPQRFAPDIVATCWGQHGSISFSPDGREAFWSGYDAIPDSGYHHSNILTSRVENGRWTAPHMPSFVDEENRGDVPFVAPDGRRVFFMSRRPLEPGGDHGAEHIWVTERDGDGWGDPRPLPPCVNGMPQHWQISVAGNGNLYFASRRPQAGTQGVYVSRPVAGIYTEPEYLGFEGSAPAIAPDESFLVTSVRYGGENHVRFRQDDGTWGEPRSLADVLPGGGGICAKVTPDGRAYFYLGHNNNDFWVDASFLEKLR